MIPIRVVVETKQGVSESIVHVVNRSQHALRGAVRAAWRRFPAAKAISAEYIEHACDACKSTHTLTPMRRVFHRTAKRSA